MMKVPPGEGLRTLGFWGEELHPGPVVVLVVRFWPVVLGDAQKIKLNHLIHGPVMFQKNSQGLWWWG